MSLHIHMTVALEGYALFLKQCPLATPAWSCTSLFVHHPMTRKILRPRRISQCASHHPWMTGPSRQCYYMPIGRHLPTRYLANDDQHILTKPPRLLWRHPIGIILHTFYYSWCEGRCQPNAMKWISIAEVQPKLAIFLANIQHLREKSAFLAFFLNSSRNNFNFSLLKGRKSNQIS